MIVENIMAILTWVKYKNFSTRSNRQVFIPYPLTDKYWPTNIISLFAIGFKSSEFLGFNYHAKFDTVRTYALKPEILIPPNPRQSLHLGRPHRMIASPQLLETLREGRRPRWLPLKRGERLKPTF